MKRNKKSLLVFLATVLVGFLLSTGAYVTAVNRAGRGYCPHAFVPAYHQYKRERLRRASSPKIVFWGGSSAQETLLPEIVSKELGMDVVLAGTIWAIPMRFLPAMLAGDLREGDVLCLMLEHKEYERSTAQILSPFGVSMLLGVDPSMQETLRPRELFDLYVRKGLGWLQCVIPKRIPHCRYLRYRSAALYDEVQRNPGRGWVVGLGTHGEDAVNYMTTCPENALIELPGCFTDEFRRSFDRVVQLARARKAKVVICNTVSYSYPRDVGSSRFCEEQAKLDVPVCCSPLELCLPYGCFSDGILHCSGAGKKYVTHQVVRGLKRILKGSVEPDVAWPLNFFSEERSDAIAFDLPEVCRTRETFAELVLDRGKLGCTNVVSRILVNGRERPFAERPYPAKNIVWTRWMDETGRAEVRVEFLDPVAGCRGERILVEPYRFDELKSLTALNDIVGFTESAGRRGRYVATGKSGQLAFRIPNWASNRYRVTLKLRMDRRLGDIRYGGVKSFRSFDWTVCAIGDVAELKIVPNESDGFVDENGDAVFGLWFDSLTPGAEVELESCAFDML